MNGATSAPRYEARNDESGSGSRVYDNFGDITSETRVIGGKTYTMSYSYDLGNRLTEIIYPSGRYVDYTYDSSGYLTTVTTKPSSGGSVTTLASSVTHKPFGPIASFTYGNSEALTNTYDSNYWLSTLNTVYSGTYLQELSYTQDNAGNLTAITDTLDSTRDESFGVDSLNRLHTASGKYGSRTYTYDNNSNRVTEVIGGGATYTYSNTASKNLLASYTNGTNTRHFTYTANGNMATDDRTFIGGGSVSNTFGGRDRLESQTVNSQSVTFKINTFGQRVSKAFSGTTTHYIHDIRGIIIAEANGSTGTTTMEYVWMEGQLLAQIDGSGNIVYVHSDYVNNPQKITNPSRTLVWDRIQEPFGEDSSTPTNTTPTNHRFPGQYFDAENSLNYNNFRDYDRSIGRYIEADPIGFSGGYNLYAYAGQNPTEATDPTGLLLRDANNNIIADRTVKHDVGTVKGNFYTLYADNLVPIQAWAPSNPADAANKTNCFGSVLADGKYWLDDAATTAVLQNDFIFQDPSNQQGDIAIFSHDDTYLGFGLASVPQQPFHGAIWNADGTVDNRKYGQVLPQQQVWAGFPAPNAHVPINLTNQLESRTPATPFWVTRWHY